MEAYIICERRELHFHLCSPEKEARRTFRETKECRRGFFFFLLFPSPFCSSFIKHPVMRLEMSEEVRVSSFCRFLFISRDVNSLPVLVLLSFVSLLLSIMCVFLCGLCHHTVLYTFLCIKEFISHQSTSKTHSVKELL